MSITAKQVKLNIILWYDEIEIEKSRKKKFYSNAILNIYIWTNSLYGSKLDIIIVYSVFLIYLHYLCDIYLSDRTQSFIKINIKNDNISSPQSNWLINHRDFF